MFWGKKPDSDAADSKKELSTEVNMPSTQVGDNMKSEQPTNTISNTKQADSGTYSKIVTSDDAEKLVQERFGAKLRAALGSGTVIQGKLSFDTPVRIDGKLKGEVFSSKALIIGPTGDIKADIEVASLYVLGAIKGTIKSREKVEIFPGGSIDGIIQTGSIVIHEGGIMNAQCSMLRTTILESEADAETLREVARKAQAATVKVPAKSGGVVEARDVVARQ